MGIFDFLVTNKQKTAQQNSIRSQIISKFYATYPEKPYISEDRKAEWIETATTFPKTAVVQKSMMIRYEDGLLPGHVYMLHWLNKYTNKKVPAYFEYKYGIDFEKERTFLLDNGFLDSMNKPTAKGEKAIVKHEEIIKNHTKKHDGCRCSIAAWEEPDEYEAWLDHLANGGSTKQFEAAKKRKRK